MPTWKKVIVSGSIAELAAVSASSGVRVGTNQQITTSPSTTFLSGSFSGSFTGNATLPSLTQAAGGNSGITNFTYNGSGAATVAVSGASTLNINRITKWTGTAFADSSLTDNGTTVSGTTSIQLSGASSSLTGSFTGSFIGNGAALTGIVATVYNPNTAVTDINTTSRFFISHSTGGEYITYSSLLTELTNATDSNLEPDGSTDGIRLKPQIAVTGVSASFTGSLTGALIGTASYATVAQTITPAITNTADNRVLTDNGNGTINGEANLTFNGTALDVRGSGGITTNQSTFPLIPSADTINLGTISNTAINIGTGTSTVTIPGNLTVNGTTTIINTTNTSVKDQFILLASGSGTQIDGGIIVQDAATTGEAFYWENDPSGTGRWAIQSAVSPTTTTVTANSYMVTVSGSNFSGAQPTAAPTYGGATNGIGNMFIDTGLTGTSDNNIWIYA